jgi:hypothetical protein
MPSGPGRPKLLRALRWLAEAMPIYDGTIPDAFSALRKTLMPSNAHYEAGSLIALSSVVVTSRERLNVSRCFALSRPIHACPRC